MPCHVLAHTLAMTQVPQPTPCPLAMQACITDLRASLIAATAAACVISHVLMGLIGGCNVASAWGSAAAVPCMFNANTEASLVPLPLQATCRWRSAPQWA